MKCEQCKIKLKEYIEGNLSTEEDDELKKHLLTCHDCSKEYELEKEEYDLFKGAFSYDYIDFKDSKEQIMAAIDKDKYKNNKSFYYKNKKIIGAIAAIFIFGVITVPIAGKLLNGKGKLDSASVRKMEAPMESSMEDGAPLANDENKAGTEAQGFTSGNGEIYLYNMEEVDSNTSLEFNTPFIASEDKSFEASIEGKGENAIEEGEGIVYVRDKTNNKLYRYVAGDGSNSALYISWYDDTHLMIIHGLSYGTLCNGTEIVMLDVTNGTQTLMITASEEKRERFKAVEKKGDKIVIKTVVYLDDTLNEFSEINKEISDYTLGKTIK